ncbi:hypothetical protein [Sulfurivermis fontis]|uniref:hypothetical protein n=1 Tax=Sulfurivermis fontis TaxID=1972068 RepID=UPI000FD90B25|nr:hypothetical protein [Sulfurivermis fontis]
MELESWGDWSEWENLLRADLSRIPDGPGAYMIAAKSSINRAYGTDEEGILDVGESGRLRHRIKSFIACANGNRRSGHMAGWRFNRFKFDSKFPLDSLYLSWHRTESKEEAYKLEEKILESYLEQHSELPPLNYKYNWASRNA